MRAFAGNTGLGVIAVFLGVAFNGAAFAKSGATQPSQAPSAAPLADRTPGATESAGRPTYLHLRYNLMLSVALSLLGAGAYSFDARLFGLARKKIIYDSGA
jgi:hypothetical protein